MGKSTHFLDQNQLDSLRCTSERKDLSNHVEYLGSTMLSIRELSVHKQTDKHITKILNTKQGDKTRFHCCLSPVGTQVFQHNR